MSAVQIDDTPAGTILTYGSVELRLCPLYQPGDLLRVSDLMRLEVVDRAEYADGIVILSQTPRPDRTRPSVMAVLFTHYIRHAMLDHIDHRSTQHSLKHPSPSLQRLTEAAFLHDLIHRSVAASFAFNPIVRYL